jgi:hypothetical protein
MARRTTVALSYLLGRLIVAMVTHNEYMNLKYNMALFCMNGRRRLPAPPLCTERDAIIRISHDPTYCDAALRRSVMIINH